MSVRWNVEASLLDVAAAEVIHARLTPEDSLALCERDDSAPRLGNDSVVLNLSMVRDHAMVERPVDCPACLEWMHA